MKLGAATNRRERWVFWLSGWALTVLGVYGATRLGYRLVETPPPVEAEAPAAPEATDAEVPALTATEPKAWADLRPDIGLSPTLNARRRALIDDLLTEEGGSRAFGWMDRYVETLAPTEYPRLLEALLQRAPSERRNAFLRSLFAQWAEVDPVQAEQALAQLPGEARSVAALAMATVKAKGDGLVNAVAWLQTLEYVSPYQVSDLVNGTWPWDRPLSDQLRLMQQLLRGEGVGWRMVASARANILARRLQRAGETQTLFDLYERLPFEPDSSLKTSVLDAVVDDNPEWGLRIAETITAPWERGGALGSVFEAQAQRDPQVMLAWARELQAQGDALAVPAAMQAYAAIDPQAVLQWGATAQVADFDGVSPYAIQRAAEDLTIPQLATYFEAYAGSDLEPALSGAYGRKLAEIVNSPAFLADPDWETLEADAARLPPEISRDLRTDYYRALMQEDFDRYQREVAQDKTLSDDARASLDDMAEWMRLVN
ncbi:MAG: hypothetical protein E1N59_1416 [Puniceicoccaceae bacterium 5H]|nr:MAG: hypothetical protein E1N59_1416 [Puniceicoccaceae bacterium 5H]